jgi:ribosomal protein L24
VKKQKQTQQQQQQQQQESNIALHTEHHAHTPNVMLPHHHNLPFTFLKIFKFSDFNKEPTSSLNMI